MKEILVGVIIALMSALGLVAYVRRDASATTLAGFLAAIGFAGIPRERLVTFCVRAGLLYSLIALVMAGMWIIPALLK